MHVWSAPFWSLSRSTPSARASLIIWITCVFETNSVLRRQQSHFILYTLGFSVKLFLLQFEPKFWEPLFWFCALFLNLTLFVEIHILIYSHTSCFRPSQILWFFCKLKVCGSPASKKPITTALQSAFVHFMSPCHTLVIFIAFQMFPLFL